VHSVGGKKSSVRWTLFLEVCCVADLNGIIRFADSNVEQYLGGFVAGRQQLPQENNLAADLNGSGLAEGNIQAGNHVRKWNYKSSALREFSPP